MAAKMLRISDCLTVVIPAALCVLAVTVLNTSAQTAGSTAEMATVTVAGATSPGIVQSTSEDAGNTTEMATVAVTRSQDSAPESTTSGESTTSNTTDSSDDMQPTQMAPSDGETPGPVTDPSGMTAEGGTTPQGGTARDPMHRCYACTTNATSDACYAEQNTQQPTETCTPGDRCWTILFKDEGEFVNLTRACGRQPCREEHADPAAVFCGQARETGLCSRCCQGDLCNSHNQSAVGCRCLSGIVLSVVALLGLIMCPA